jgi:hypothetical protein
VKGLGWATLLVAGPFFLLALLFGLPLLGNVAGLLVIDHFANCTQQAGTFQHCWLLGRDVAELANGYAIGIFLGGLLNPFLFARLLATYLTPLPALLWAVASLTLVALWWRRRRRLRA